MMVCGTPVNELNPIICCCIIVILLCPVPPHDGHNVYAAETSFASRQIIAAENIEKIINSAQILLKTYLFIAFSFLVVIK